MENLCRHCEYGNRFVDLGKCPDCGKGCIIGDAHTRGIFCSELHLIKSVAVDFYVDQNCWDAIHLQQYTIIIASGLSMDEIRFLSKYFKQTAVQIYKAVRYPHTSHTSTPSLSGELCFDKLMQVGQFLYERHIPFTVTPDPPLLYRIGDCFSIYHHQHEWLDKYYENRLLHESEITP